MKDRGQLGYTEDFSTKVFVPELNRHLVIDYDPELFKRDFCDSLLAVVPQRESESARQYAEQAVLIFEDPAGQYLKHLLKTDPSKLLVTAELNLLGLMTGGRPDDFLSPEGLANGRDGEVLINFERIVYLAACSLPTKMRTAEMILRQAKKQVESTYVHERQHFATALGPAEPQVWWQEGLVLAAETAKMSLAVAPSLIWAMRMLSEPSWFYEYPLLVSALATVILGLGNVFMGMNIRGFERLADYCLFDDKEKKSNEAGKKRLPHDLDDLFRLWYE